MQAIPKLKFLVNRVIQAELYRQASQQRDRAYRSAVSALRSPNELQQVVHELRREYRAIEIKYRHLVNRSIPPQAGRPAGGDDNTGSH